MRIPSRFLGAVITAILGYFLLSTTGKALLYDVIGLAAGLAMLLGIHRYRPQPTTAWLLLAFGVLTLSLGDAVYGVWQPVPSPADMLYISGYVLLIMGTVGLVPSRGTDRSAPSLIVAGCTAASVGVVAWLFLLVPGEGETGIHLSTMAVSVGYPVLDLVLIAALILIGRRSGRFSTSSRMLIGAVLLLLVADVIFAAHDFGTAYSVGETADAVWLLAYGLFGAALLHPSVRGAAGHAEVEALGWSGASALRAVRFRTVVASTGRLVLGLAVLVLVLGASQHSVNTIVLSGAYGTVGMLLMLVSAVRV